MNPTLIRFVQTYKNYVCKKRILPSLDSLLAIARLRGLHESNPVGVLAFRSVIRGGHLFTFARPPALSQPETRFRPPTSAAVAVNWLRNGSGGGRRRRPNAPQAIEITEQSMEPTSGLEPLTC